MPENHNLKTTNINSKSKVYWNLGVTELTNKAVERGEGEISKVGALTVTTGKYTGRSPQDRFIVDELSVHNQINWGKINIPLAIKDFDKLYRKITKHLSSAEELFVFNGLVGADPKHSLKVTIVNEFASQNLAIRQLLRKPKADQLKNHNPDFTILVAPNCHADPKIHHVNSEVFVVISFEKKVVLIGATKYIGEIKKSIFSIMNYLLPGQGVFPMHCSANMGKKGDTALFFGLSGTGKTSLSADPERKLIGDDEHGWSPDGVFNFEGGCYAKCINLSKEHEPQIYNAIKYGAVAENIILNPKTKEYDFNNSSLTENTRATFPIEFIPDAELTGVGSHPKTIIFLTADAFGVIPPIAKLTYEQAMYHFMSGYTSKLAGTERGIIEPKATFSSFFGEPFMPRKPMVYSNLLKNYIKKYGADVFLINTGWSGGPYVIGQRIPIKLTRIMVKNALNRNLDQVEYKRHPIFNLMMPVSCPDIPSEILDPINTWDDKKKYLKQAKMLSGLFKKNFEKFKEVPDAVRSAGPQ
ncbi:MAG: phosphoenolpyruvate carboxykinase (ATP) [Candidatus Kerfeldbacteria bacterium CG08_land_8_20_14_0_20_40_16]|uniref:Phosphoenolpyruvate carboxykinase (ATP) n=1 Tax=Candidatus Kerfeldbacteria bacterium CG08_land_8_20_14_0_20_40_16 TaxID=2014244 RepID=A0A2H0YVA9_9BACT|nr:MAG: phosphoenolpyruvate carboxykinase (ATP) [Candidatus Kerfeldbacteria bacterium CG08_land_8_20_14_0_20_40_16]